MQDNGPNSTQVQDLALQHATTKDSYRDHDVRVSIYRHATRRTRGVIAECDTCGWTGPMRTEAFTKLALVDANNHVRAHRPKRPRRKAS